MSHTVPLIMLSHTDNQELYRLRLRAWQDILREGAVLLSGNGNHEDDPAPKAQVWYLSEVDACLRLGRRSPQLLPEGGFETASFRLGPTAGTPWLVQINLPSFTERGSTRLAREGNGSGRIWLMRRGKLQPNGETVEVSEDVFRGRWEPDDVLSYDGKAAYPGAWYKVAMLDGTHREIRAQTGLFLRRCDSVRHLYVMQLAEDAAVVGTESRGEPPGPASAPPVEPVGSYNVAAQAEKLVHQRQGKVLKRLHDRLRAAGISPFKIACQGFACDLLIHVYPADILIEIKTGALANDIYTGVGQLMLYPRRLKLKEPLRRVLLLPYPSQSDLVNDVRDQGIEVGFYKLKGLWSEEDPEIEFFPEFLALCGVP